MTAYQKVQQNIAVLREAAPLEASGTVLHFIGKNAIVGTVEALPETVSLTIHNIPVDVASEIIKLLTK